MNQILDGARIVLCLGFLVYASWCDYKTREVSNKVWVIFGPLALLLTGVQILLFSSQPVQMVTFYVLSFAITSGLAITIFYVGGFGGADAKALMCIALALPVYPEHLMSHSVGFVSPLFPPSCRFHPSCSTYTIQAIGTHGAVAGLALAVRRVLRCHPFHPGGWDPVPPADK